MKEQSLPFLFISIFACLFFYKFGQNSLQLSVLSTHIKVRPQLIFTRKVCLLLQSSFHVIIIVNFSNFSLTVATRELRSWNILHISTMSANQPDSYLNQPASIQVFLDKPCCFWVLNLIIQRFMESNLIEPAFVQVLSRKTHV